MLAFIIAPFFIALLVLVFIRTIKHINTYKLPGLKVVEYLFGLLLFGGLCSIIIGFILPTNIVLKRVFTKIGYYWLGLILYLFVGLTIALLTRVIVWIFKRKQYNKKIARDITTIFVIAFTIIMSIYGITNAHKLRVTNYEVSVNKESKLEELNVVLIADLHLGYNVGIDEMQDMVEKINNQKPDVVVVAGDIFDNEYDALENPEILARVLSNINAKYGKYAIFGNHDIEEKILVGFTFDYSDEAKENASADERMIKFISDSDFKLLYDSYELIGDDIYIYGRPDAHKFNLGNKERKSPTSITENLDKTKTIICLDHQPGELTELANAGVDIDLSAHTHNGQIWPGTISIKWIWKNAYGLKQIGNMKSIVTSGVGLFGVNMRTGCYPEIVYIKINFK